MPFKSTAIANFFLDCAAESPLTQMKLQKLVYFAHGWNLGLVDEPLIDEVVQAWSYGPVIMSLYKAFGEFGGKIITEKAIDFRKSGPGPFDLVAVTPSVDEDDPVRSLLRRVWEVYGKFSATQLSNMTHAPGTPWDQIFKKYEGKIPKYATIPDDIIAAYFRREGKRNEQKADP